MSWLKLHINNEVSLSGECAASSWERKELRCPLKNLKMHQISLFKTEKEPNLQQEEDLGEKWSSLSTVPSSFFTFTLQVHCFLVYFYDVVIDTETPQRPPTRTARK